MAYHMPVLQLDLALEDFGFDKVLDSSSSCRFLRYLCAVDVTILAKKFMSVSHIKVFQIKVKEKFHCFPFIVEESEAGPGADKYFSLIMSSLAITMGSIAEKLESLPNTKTNFSSISSRSWLLHSEMINTVEASTKMVKKLICCECERSQRFIRDINPSSSEEAALNSSMASNLFPDKRAALEIK